MNQSVEPKQPQLVVEPPKVELPELTVEGLSQSTEETNIAEKITTLHGQTTSIQHVDESVFQSAEVVGSVSPPTPAMAQPPITPVVQPQPQISAAGKQILLILEEYVSLMSQKKTLNPQQGAMYQAQLYHALLGAVTASQQDFKAVMDQVLSMIHKHIEGVFSYQNVYRYQAHLTLQKPAVDCFRQLINLFTSLANPQLRQLAIKQVDFESTLNHRFIPEDARQRVLDYFNIK